MNAAYFVKLSDGSEHLVWAGHQSVVDCADAAHVQPFNAVRDGIVHCTGIVSDKEGNVVSIHHYAGMEARIVASLESRRIA